MADVSLRCGNGFGARHLVAPGLRAKPQRLSSGSTVMSKAPALSFDSSPAKETSSSIGAGKAMQLPAGKALKRSTSESAR